MTTPPLCPACEKKQDGASPAVPDADDIPRLETPAARDDFPGLVHETLFRHGSSASLLRARYSFEDEVLCSLPGRHRHQKGVVFETYCGQIISTGMDCGKRDILGWGSIAGYIDVVDKHAANVVNLSKRPQGHIATLEGLRVSILDSERRRSIFSTHLPKVAATMKERARKKGAKAATVTIKQTYRDADGKEKVRDRDVRLTGLELWSATGMTTKLDTSIRATRQLVDDVASTQLNRQSSKPLTTRLRQLDNAVRDLKEWADASAQFFSESNINLALLAAEHKGPPASGGRLSLPTGHTYIVDSGMLVKS